MDVYQNLNKYVAVGKKSLEQVYVLTLYIEGAYRQQDSIKHRKDIIDEAAMTGFSIDATVQYFTAVE